MNNLVVNNVQFIDNSSVAFTAKSSIELNEGTLLEPNSSNKIELAINSSMQLATCILPSRPLGNNESPMIENNDENYIIYPNPIKQTMNISKIDKFGDKISKIVIYNVVGVLLEGSEKIDDYDLSYDISMLSSGIYIVKGFDLDQNVLFSKKIIKE